MCGHIPRAAQGAHRRAPLRRRRPPRASHAHRRRHHTGHASAGGFLLALCHDYRVMRADRGVLYMSEVDMGFPLPPYFTAVLRGKITAAQALRDAVLRGARLRALQAKEIGIVDVVCPGAPETAAEAIKLAARKWDGAVYSSIRISMFPDACRSVGIVVDVSTNLAILLSC
uniref:Uncharacterized protein n=1 Tax=Avena sativa TaxID=4498 RepID=A0ACD5U1F2_AVESA